MLSAVRNHCTLGTAYSESKICAAPISLVGYYHAYDFNMLAASELFTSLCCMIGRYRLVMHDLETDLDKIDFVSLMNCSVLAHNLKVVFVESLYGIFMVHSRPIPSYILKVKFKEVLTLSASIRKIRVLSITQIDPHITKLMNFKDVLEFPDVLLWALYPLIIEGDEAVPCFMCVFVNFQAQGLVTSGSLLIISSTAIMEFAPIEAIHPFTPVSFAHSIIEGMQMLCQEKKPFRILSRRFFKCIILDIDHFIRP